MQSFKREVLFFIWYISFVLLLAILPLLLQFVCYDVYEITEADECYRIILIYLAIYWYMVWINYILWHYVNEIPYLTFAKIWYFFIQTNRKRLEKGIGLHTFFYSVPFTLFIIGVLIEIYIYYTYCFQCYTNTELQQPFLWERWYSYPLVQFYEYRPRNCVYCYCFDPRELICTTLLLHIYTYLCVYYFYYNWPYSSYKPKIYKSVLQQRTYIWGSYRYIVAAIITIANVTMLVYMIPVTTGWEFIVGEPDMTTKWEFVIGGPEGYSFNCWLWYFLLSQLFIFFLLHWKKCVYEKVEVSEEEIAMAFKVQLANYKHELQNFIASENLEARHFWIYGSSTAKINLALRTYFTVQGISLAFFSAILKKYLVVTYIPYYNVFEVVCLVSFNLYIYIAIYMVIMCLIGYAIWKVSREKPW